MKKPAVLPAENICLSCGLCCNGVIFADVKLLPGEDSRSVLKLGLPLVSDSSSRTSPRKRRWKFPQPCAALEGCCCRIYASRPIHCRRFECLLLKKVKRGAMTRAGSLRVIRHARRQAERVTKLLNSLGDTDESSALADRVHRIARRLGSCEVGSPTAELYSQLTLAFHRLSLILNNAFYPAPRQP